MFSSLHESFVDTNCLMPKRQTQLTSKLQGKRNDISHKRALSDKWCAIIKTSSLRASFLSGMGPRSMEVKIVDLDNSLQCEELPPRQVKNMPFFLPSSAKPTKPVHDVNFLNTSGSTCILIFFMVSKTHFILTSITSCSFKYSLFLVTG